MPYSAGDDGVGVPESRGAYPHAFGGDGTGSGIDLTETHQLLDILTDLGIGLLSTTAGSPYYNPHIQRPAYFPPSDGYQPPEDPLVGVARQLAATAELARRHPRITIVGSGYSYLQDWLPNVAQAWSPAGERRWPGLGRMVLSYPRLAADVLAGRTLQTRARSAGRSATARPRRATASCRAAYPLDPFYKEHPQRVELTRAKKDAKARLR